MRHALDRLAGQIPVAVPLPRRSRPPETSSRAESESPPVRPWRQARATHRRTPRTHPHVLDRGMDYWVTRVGIGLLLLGVAFLFKYAVDKGWLVPWLRITFGLLTGVVLAVIRFRVPTERRRFSQVMLGGAVATWYMTGFAAFQLLELVSYQAAFAFMGLVTLFTFFTSIRQDAPALSVVGTLGGLSTPFLLYSDTRSVPGLVGYTVLLLAGTSAIYLVRGWRSLLWTAALGGWPVLFSAVLWLDPGDRPALQAGFGALWLLFWIAPILREILAEREPERWPRPLSDNWTVSAFGKDDLNINHLTVLVLLVPLLALTGSLFIWNFSERLWGTVAIGMLALYAIGAWYLSRHDRLRVLTSAHRVTAAAFAIMGVGLLLDRHPHFLGWAILGLLLHLGARYWNDRALGVTGHLLFATLAVWLGVRLTGEAPPEVALLNARAIVDLAVMGTAVAAARWTGRVPGATYLIAAHAALLAWLWRELAVLPAGDGIVTAAWGAYGLLLLLLLKQYRKVGLATMFLPVGKLILYDLSNVDPFWRILLFLGFGGVFLALGYYFPALWKDEDGDSPPSTS